MVVFEATFDVTQWREIVSSRREDGNDEITETVTIEEDRTVHIDQEFPDGHVNLEAWIPSLAPDVFHEKMFHKINMLFEGDIEIQTRDVSISGNAGEWVDQIERYISERPDMNFSDGIFYFKDCEEVDMPNSIFDALVERRRMENNREEIYKDFLTNG